MAAFEDITQTIGRTPLIKLRNLPEVQGLKIWLKLEFFNPLGSVKDRIGLAMIEAAEKSGALKKGMQVVEPTSGNTGISLAFICAARGYSLTLVMPETMSMERRILALLFNAKLVLTPGSLGMRGATAKALEICSSDPKNFIMLRQFENSANPEVHARTTAAEIWSDTNGEVDIIVSGIGTGGTATGVGRALKARKKSLKIIAVEPTESPVLSGGRHTPHKIQGIGAGFVPPVLDRAIIDSIEQVSSEEALAMARRLIKEEGVPVGISSGAAMVAAVRVAKANSGKCVVVIIPSTTERYLSTLLAESERQQAAGLTAQPVDEEWLKKVPYEVPTK